MRVIKPIAITNTEFLSSTIPEPDPSVGEVVWTNAGFIGDSVPEILNAVAVTYDGDRYSVIGWDSSSLIATAYIYDSNFNFVTSKTFTSGQPYVSGDKIDACFDGVNFWFSNGDQISMYDTNWNYANKTINTDADFANAYVQTICSDGAHIYLAMKDFTDATYKMAKYELISSGFVESKELQANLEISLLGSAYQGGLIKHIARGSFDSDPIRVYTTGTNLDGFDNVAELESLDPQLDIGFERTSNGYITLNPTGKRIVKFKVNYSLDGVYEPEDRVIKTNTHKVYQCSIATSDDPEAGVIKIPPTWVEVSATNKWAMFDYKKGVKTKNSSSIDVQLEFQSAVTAVSALALENVTSIRVIATSASAGEVYNKLHDTTGLIELVDLDLPPFNDLTIEVEFVGVDVQVGELVVGDVKYLGALVAGVVSDRIDYSRLVYDDFGEVTYIERPIVKYTTYPVAIGRSEAPGIENYLDSIKGVQAVWVGDSGGGDLVVTYGRIERSPMTYSNPSIVEYQIKVRGSI